MDPPLDPDSMNKTQLQAELKKRGLKQHSNKPDQIQRLKVALEQEKNTSATPGSSSFAAPRVPASVTSGRSISPEKAASLSPTGGAAPLKKGNALKSFLPEDGYPDFCFVTTECLHALRLYIEHGSFDEGVKPNDHLKYGRLNGALNPALMLCQRLGQCTEEVAVTSSYANNLIALNRAMEEHVELLVRKYPGCLKDERMMELISIFRAADATPFPQQSQIGPSESEDTAAQEQEELDLQQAIHNSLQHDKDENDKYAEAQQISIQDFYKSMGGDIGLDEDRNGQSDFPEIDQIVEKIPAEGTTFASLTRKHNIFAHDQDVLDALLGELLSNHADLIGDKIFKRHSPTTVEKDARGLPTDNTVRSAIMITSTGSIELPDLLKIGNVRSLGEKMSNAFVQGLLDRKVVRVNDSHLFVLVSDSAPPLPSTKPTPSRNPMMNAPNMTPTPKSGAASRGDPEKSSEIRRARMEPPIMFTPKKEEDLYEQEMWKIKDLILAHLRNWQAGFPRPALCSFPGDLTPQERTKVKAHVGAYMDQQKLYSKNDTNTLAAIIAAMLTDPAFPVKEAKHEAALRAIVKERFHEHAKLENKKMKAQEKKAAADAAEAAEAGSEGGGDEAADDDAAGETPTGRGRGRGRGPSRDRGGRGRGAGRGKQSRKRGRDDDSDDNEKDEVPAVDDNDNDDDDEQQEGGGLASLRKTKKSKITPALQDDDDVFMDG